MAKQEVKLMLGNNLELLKKLPDNSIDSVVTDPPYGLSFMNKRWDYDVPSVHFWMEVWRVLKPGGHVLSFGGTRTYHRMVVNIEDAGFEIRDQIMWLYASGFPKSLNVKKQFDKNEYKVCECSKQNTEHDLRQMPKANISQTINTQSEQGKTLLSQLPKQDIQISKHTTSDVWREQSSVEGWNNSIQEEGKLQRNNIQESTRTSKRDGEEGWLYNGTSNDNGSDGEQITNKNRGGSSYRPQSKQQSSEQFRTMADKRRPQESGSGKICGRCGEQVIPGLDNLGTSLKPANEPICLARKPLSEKSVAENVIKWKTGGINIDGCRVGSETITINRHNLENISGTGMGQSKEIKWSGESVESEGRFPANIILECCCDEVIKGEKGEPFNYKGKEYSNKETSMFNGDKPEAPSNYNDKGDIHTNPECPCYIMDEQSGDRKGFSGGGGNNIPFTDVKNTKSEYKMYNDKGGASRFFYQAKVSKAERNMGLDEFEDKIGDGSIGLHSVGGAPTKDNKRVMKNNHPTVKPINLMSYLCRLITPEGGIVLDPFMGSGSTGISARLEGFRFIGMEMEEDYFKIAESRINSYGEYKKFKK